MYIIIRGEHGMNITLGEFNKLDKVAVFPVPGCPDIYSEADSSLSR